MRLNIELNQELGIRIWSFPMRYQPVTLKDRSHVGKKWNRYYLPLLPGDAAGYARGSEREPVVLRSGLWRLP